MSGFLAASLSASAQVSPDYGLDFVTIGDPGNRPTNPDEVPADPSLRIGAVPYVYRIMRDKVSVDQYMEFVNAYGAFWQGSPTDIELTGVWGLAVQQPDGHWLYAARSGAGHFAAQITWEMAARYCNWLCNGQGNTAGAFENGAYDTSTFQHGAGWWTNQTVHNPGARYWIPTLDEWIKATHYDPNRHGPSQGGYWAYPNRSDLPLVMALPEQGGQTIGDLLWRHDPNRIQGAWDLGQYPQVQTPWGLIDVSATAADYTSTVVQPYGAVATGGSLAGDPSYSEFDRIDIYREGFLFGDLLEDLRVAGTAHTAAGASELRPVGPPIHFRR